MNYNIMALIISVMLLVWQIMMWKKIKLPKMIDYFLSVLALSLLVWFVYLSFSS